VCKPIVDSIKRQATRIMVEHLLPPQKTYVQLDIWVSIPQKTVILLPMLHLKAAFSDADFLAHKLHEQVKISNYSVSSVFFECRIPSLNGYARIILPVFNSYSEYVAWEAYCEQQ